MRTPGLAVWLLRTLGSGDWIEVLLGDLIEEREQGRSRWWFWQQVVVAVAVDVLATVQTHKRLAIESVVVGWAALMSLSSLSGELITRPLVLQLFAGRGLTGWGIALLHLPEWALTMFGSSWLVARLHPRYSFAMANAFVASFLANHAATVAWLVGSRCLHGQPISANDWWNLLTVPFTFGLMLAGAVRGARRPAPLS
jgi:hypothetical protein